MNIVIVYGTRPEAVKLSKVVEALRARGESPTVVCTNQHTDLLRGTPAENTMRPDVNLGLPGQENPFMYVGDCGHALIDVFQKHRPDVVVVQGDTASAMAGSQAARIMGIPIAHVEAGVRTGDPFDPWPEENFRVRIDEFATMCYAPTEHCRENLIKELRGVPGCVTGNPGIDALYSHTQPVEHSQKVDRVLITLHRRESFGEPLREIVRGLIAGANQHKDLMFWWVTHPNPRVQEALPVDRPRNLILVPPLGTVEFAHYLATAKAVISDSGGVQEEACALGIPAVIAREKTDRPESVELGLAQVAGRTEAGIVAGLQWALDAKIEPSTVFGDGHASERIVCHLLGDQ